MNDVKLMMLGAVAFEKAAKELLNADRMDCGAPFFWNAYYYNISLSFELSLKCFLAHSGFDSKRMAKEIGHDLIKGLDVAIENGFQPHSEDMKYLIEILGPPYHSHVFRYLTNNWPRLPNSDNQALELLTNHVTAVAIQVGLDKNYADS